MNVANDMNARFKQARKALGLRQGELAEGLGLKQASVSSIETRGTTLTDKNIKLMSIIYGVSETWLRYGTGDMMSSSAICDGAGACYFRHLSEESKEIARNFLRHLHALERK